MGQKTPVLSSFICFLTECNFNNNESISQYTMPSLVLPLSTQLPENLSVLSS